MVQSSFSSWFGSPPLATLALVALTSPFLVSGLLKLMNFADAVSEVRALTGLQGSTTPRVAALVILVQLGGSALVLSGHPWSVTGGAALLAGFTIVATLLAHAWWTRESPDRARDIAAFFEHVAICGGLALATVVVWQR